MRRLTYLGALALVLMVAIAPSAGATGQTVTVSIGDFYFSPANITVQPGTAVTFVNEGQEPHTATAFNGQFDSGVLNPGDSYTVVFKGWGTIAYYCEIHPDMRGSVSVGTPTTTGGASGQPMAPQPMMGQPTLMYGGY
jgi:plastocyanin